MKLKSLLGIIIIVFCSRLSVASDDRVLLDLRLLANHGEPVLKTTLRNPHEEYSVRFDGTYYNNFNGFRIRHLDADGRTFARSNIYGEILRVTKDWRPRPLIEVAPTSSHTMAIDISVHCRGLYYPMLIGRYQIFRWSVSPWRSNVKGASSQPVCFGVSDADGNIRSPVVDPRDPTASAKLAFVFNEDQPNELGFLFFNGSEEAVTIEKPLTEASRIVATSPASDYTRELFLADQATEMIEIEVGEVGEWRIPWPTIRELIHEADLTAIKEGGGDLDLVWKVGDFQSDLLPLSLSDPPNNDN